jgi:hypothetical protein
MDAVQWDVHVERCLEELVYVQRDKIWKALRWQLTVIMLYFVLDSVGYMLKKCYQRRVA